MGKIGFEKLAELRVVYNEELQKREKKYSKIVEDAKAEYNRVLKVDYIDEFKEEFEVSLNSLERLYDELVEIYSVTKGLTFSVTSYIKTLSPRNITKGGVFEHFDKLVGECKSALSEINNSITPEEDVPHIKKFCQGVVDLRHIVKNARQLVVDTGRAEMAKQEKLAELKEEINKAQDLYNKNLKLESFNCYKVLNSYRNELIEGNKAISSKMLSNKPIISRGDYKCLMGFQTQNIPEEDLKFAKQVLGLSSSVFSANPVYFDLKVGHTCLLINAPSAYFDELEFDDLIKNIYFSFASNLPAQDLLIAPVEHQDITASTMQGLENTIKKEVNDNKSEDGIYLPTAKKDEDIISGIEKIKELANVRSAIYRPKRIKDIFAYNKLDSLTTDYFILYLANRYPIAYSNTRMNGYEEIKRMATSNGDAGVISVICQATDGVFTETLPKLTAEELNADVINVLYTKDKNGVDISYKYNNMPVSLDIKDSDNFDEATYWKNYAKYFNNASTIWLYDILDKFNNKPAKPYYEQISLPVGFSDGMPFEYSMDVCTVQNFGLITGKSGSGKSSFLHTLILSAASRYSPEELRIRLVDFKSKKDSPEFSQYKKKVGVDNLYVPHIDYLLVNGKPECALDLFNMITNIIKERTEIFNQANCAEFTRYMKSEEVKSGKLPKLPFLLYIIDEYNLMIDGGDKSRSSSVRKQIIAKIEATVKSARAFGIGLLFSGQSVVSDMDGALSQMDSRIGLMNNESQDYQSLMGNINKNDSTLDMSFLRGKGYSVFSVDAGRTRKRVRHAYAGNTGCKEQLEFTKKIREKYGKYDQIVAGSEDFYEIREENSINETIEGNGMSQLHIPVGVTSASMVKSCLEFSNSKAAVNYYSFGSLKQLFKLEQNAIFGYLNEMANLGYKDAKVVVLADDDFVDNCLSEFLDKYPQLKNKFVIKSTYSEMAKEIANLHETYAERNTTKLKSECTPIFIVAHDIEWLADNDDSWVDYANEDDGREEPETAPKENNSEYDKLFKEALAEVNANKVYAKMSQAIRESAAKNMVEKMLSESGVKPKTSGKKVDRSSYTADTYVNMFKTLYSRGNRCGMYMLVASENYTPIKKIILSDYEEAQKIKDMYSVYGSEEEFAENKIDKDAILECVYVSTNNAKTRLYDYSIAKNKDFWNAFVTKITK